MIILALCKSGYTISRFCTVDFCEGGLCNLFFVHYWQNLGRVDCVTFFCPLLAKSWQCGFWNHILPHFLLQISATMIFIYCNIRKGQVQSIIKPWPATCRSPSWPAPPEGPFHSAWRLWAVPVHADWLDNAHLAWLQTLTLLDSQAMLVKSDQEVLSISWGYKKH